MHSALEFAVTLGEAYTGRTVAAPNHTLSAFKLPPFLLLVLLAAALPCAAQTPDQSLPKPWRGAFVSYGPSVLFLPRHAGEGYVERGGVRIGYVRPISSSTGGMVALEVQRLALDHDHFYRKSAKTIDIDGSQRSVVTDLQGGGFAMQSVILGLEITGAPVVGSTFTYLQGGVAMTRLVDEPLRYFALGKWYTYPGDTQFRPGGVLGGGVRLAFPGGVHGVLDGGYSLTLEGRRADNWLHLLSLRLGLAYRL